MILVVFGTTGELIKLAPVLLRLRARGHPYLLATTGQQITQIPASLDQFGLPQPDVWLGRGAQGRDLSSNGDIPGWLRTVAQSFRRHRRSLLHQLREGPGRPLLLVHGDTMTTVLGALMGRALRVPVAHIEGGLRSGNLRNPFPEELDRRLTSRLASIHYAPGPWAASHLRRGIVVDTGSNTIRDSLELVPNGVPAAIPIPSEPFGIVSLHRFELLNSRRLLSGTLTALAEAPSQAKLLFVDHPVTIAAIERYGLGHVFGERLVRIPRLPFFDFVQLERRCSFVVTDSGGSQEECYYLDKPCLVHRRRTERIEGLGENAVLSGLDVEVVTHFLHDRVRLTRTSALPTTAPSEVITEHLLRMIGAKRNR